MRKLSAPFCALLLVITVLSQQKPKTEHSVAGARASTAITPPTNAPLPSEETVNGFLQQMFGYDSSVTWKIADIRPAKAESLAQVDVILSNPQGQQATTLYVTADGQHALVGDLIPFGADPFAAARDQLKKEANGIARGPENAPLTIVEFSDLQCPHCKQAQPTVQRLLADEPNARFVFQQFPLPSHDWAAKAASYADCIGRSNADAFWKFVDATYNAQSEITQANADEKLNGLADSSGAKSADVAACAAKPDTKARIDKSIELGKAVDVTGTPALFINGRKISNLGIPYEVLKSIADFGAKQGK
jgi:protein-disulfide isomerase